MAQWQDCRPECWEAWGPEFNPWPGQVGVRSPGMNVLKILLKCIEDPGGIFNWNSEYKRVKPIYNTIPGTGTLSSNRIATSVIWIHRKQGGLIN